MTIRQYSLLLCSLFWLASDAQLLDLETAPTTCVGRCDGQAFIHIKGSTYGKELYWKPEQEVNYTPLNGSLIQGLCEGQYRIRMVEARYDAPDPILATMEADSGYYLLSSYALESLGKMSISLELKMNMQVNYMNYYLQARYSVDGGESWFRSSQIHQMVSEGKDNDAFTYRFDLPRRAEGRKEVLVDIQRRLPGEGEQIPDIRVMEMVLFSKRVEEFSFEIGRPVGINIRSTVSNITDEESGAIRLYLSGGEPPYSYRWQDGAIADEQRDHLAPGQYSVEVRDALGCEARSEFSIVDETAEHAPSFILDSIPGQSGKFTLRIQNILRKPIDVVFVAQGEHEEAHRFRVNPLYEDLDIPIDLNSLAPAVYTAQLRCDSIQLEQSVTLNFIEKSD